VLGSVGCSFYSRLAVEETDDQQKDHSSPGSRLSPGLLGGG
jgi:hypothetical protein